ncbi:MAG: type II and III secretion system protein [Planctomycetota bacterium]|nr:type II and III secretion system protein [Planctomycetota bacterium]MDA1112768.1 type II and III secretion system protein [Planctomycetota bacterium]
MFSLRQARLAPGTLMLLGLLALNACSFFEPEPEVPQTVVQDPVFSGPQTFEEEFPYVRIQENGDGSLSAVLTVPKGSGVEFKTRLDAQCECLQIPEGGEAEATVEVITEGGKVYNNDLTAKRFPWITAGEFRAVEDLLVLTGDEESLREMFDSVDAWFNSGPQISIEAVVTENLNNSAFDRGMVQVADNPLFQDSQSNSFLRSIGGNFPSPTNPTTGGAGLGGAFQVGLIDSSFQLDAVLQFLRQKGLVDIVSQPRIVTRNGVTASVESVEEIPFLKVGNVTLNGSTAFTIGTNRIGVKMFVTPFLVGVDTIHLVIDVEISRLGQDFVIGTDANNQQIVAPSLNTRKASTEVYVRNGTHVIIGGLKLIEHREIESKVPILGDIPVIGWFFSSRSDEDVETTVTFMFTPKIKDRPSIDRFGVGEFFDPFDQAEGSN